MTTIQISDSIKKELLEMMGDLQKELGRKATYEDIIIKLINHYNIKLEARREHSRKYFGILKGKEDDVRSLLKESRDLERF